MTPASIWEGNRADGTDVCKLCGSLVWWRQYDTHEHWHAQLEAVGAIVSMLRLKYQ